MNRKTPAFHYGLIAVCLMLWMTGTALGAEPGVLHGKVVDAVDRLPIKLAKVRVVETGKEVEVNEAGEFDLANMTAGPVALEVSAFGYKSRTLHATVASGQTTFVEVTLNNQPLLNEVMVVTATLQPEPLSALTQSAGVVNNETLRASKTVGIDEVLNEIPGVKAESQAETQEARVSIRGRGVRTAFGVRGVRMLVDGIPESDSTGETQDLTGFDLSAMERIEVVKGPMSARYGATSAGVINMITEQGADVPNIEFSSVFGSYDFMKNQLKVSGTYKPMQYLFNFSRTELDGYREHSHLLAYRLTSRLDFAFDPKTKFSLFVRATDSDSQLPGNLSAADLEGDRRQAAFLFKLFDAQSNIDRVLVGGTFTRRMGTDRELSATFFGRHFDFEVPVPFVFLAGERKTWGGNARYTFKESIGGKSNFFALGVEAQHNHEDRTNYDNNAGNKGVGIQVMEARNFSNVGIYFLDQIKLGEKFDVRAGISYARVMNHVDDLLLADGNDSGERNFQRTTFHVGGAYHFRPEATVYANVSTGFEPPTDSEIGRNPDGHGGLNRNIKPEKTTNYEVGGLFNYHHRAFLNVAAFHLRVDDEIVPTGIGFPQEIFGNAAKAIHNGFELGAGVDLMRDLDFRTAYTFSDFYFKQFINDVGDFSGNQLPGIPRNRLNTTLRYRNPLGIYSTLNWEYVGKIFAEDANQVVNGSYHVVDWYVGYNRFIKHLKINLQYRINNLFDNEYNAYVVVNDRFRGYFYPAPTRNHSGTVSIGWFF